jgi:hypothetical protein
VSFDFDRDQKLKTFILAQARNTDSPFEIENWSLNEPAPQRSWKETPERESHGQTSCSSWSGHKLTGHREYSLKLQLRLSLACR